MAGLDEVRRHGRVSGIGAWTQSAWSNGARRLGWSVLVAFGLFASEVATADGRVPIGAWGSQSPGILVESVALQDDATALYVNPAALGRAVPWGLYAYYSADHANRGVLAPSGLTTGIAASDLAPGEVRPVEGDAWGAAATWGAFGLGYEQARRGRDRSSRRATLGWGWSAPFGLRLGLRTTWQHEVRPVDAADPGGGSSGRVHTGDSTWRWDAGLLHRPTRYLSWGARVSDLGRSILFDEALSRRYRYGLALRPLPGAWRTRVTTFADLESREDTRWMRESALDAGVSLQIVPGVWAEGATRGRLDDFSATQTWRFGMRVDFVHTTLFAGARLDGGDRTDRALYSFHHTGARQRTVLAPESLAKMTIGGRYGDESQWGLLLPLVGVPAQQSVRSLFAQLERAETDSRVRGVLLELRPMSGGALSEELRVRVRRVRAAGKPVVAYMEWCSGWSQYALAAACDRVVLEPVSGIQRLGLRAEIPYLGGVFDSLGIGFEKAKQGAYKTALEEFLRSDASPELKESLGAVFDDLQRGLTEEVVRDRGLDPAGASEWADGRSIEAPRALEIGLVDSLGSRKDAEAWLRDLSGVGASPVSLAGWVDRRSEWAHGPLIAVVWCDGAIEMGKSYRDLSRGNILGAGTVAAQLEALAASPRVRAVVLRIDSPGGSSLASDQMWRAVEQFRDSGKPVVASMSRAAASGGYYLAGAAHEIVADASTLTGSIGVFLLKPHLHGLYERLGARIEVLERGSMMGLYSPMFPWTDEQRAHMQRMIDLLYDRFLECMAKYRPLTREELEAVAQGRVWTGRDAYERGLVDHLGDLEVAIERARALAGLSDDAEVVDLTRPQPSLFERLVFDGGALAGARLRGLNGVLAALRGPRADGTSAPLLDPALDATIPSLEPWRSESPWLVHLTTSF